MLKVLQCPTTQKAVSTGTYDVYFFQKLYIEHFLDLADNLSQKKVGFAFDLLSAQTVEEEHVYTDTYKAY